MKIFCVALQSACASRKRRGKTPKQICYVSYCKWAIKITKNQEEVTFKHYKYFKEVHNIIRVMAPNDLKGDILEHWYKFSLKKVYEALQKKLL